MRLDAYAHDRDRLSETGHLLENISVGGKCGTRTANEAQEPQMSGRICSSESEFEHQAFAACAIFAMNQSSRNLLSRRLLQRASRPSQCPRQPERAPLVNSLH